MTPHSGHVDSHHSVFKILALFFVISAISLAMFAANVHSHKHPRLAKSPDDNQPIFLPPSMYTAGGFGITRVVAADLNGDGRPDLIVTLMGFQDGDSEDGGVSVLLAKADGTFQTPVTYPSGGREAMAVAVGDVNHDGKPDLLVANWCVTGKTCDDPSAVVGVLIGNGDGTFQPVVKYRAAGYGGSDIALADLNRDGNPDVLLSNDTVTVLLGNGDGTFQPPLSYDPGGLGANAIEVADLNNDGVPDVVTTTTLFGTNQLVIAVLLGDGVGGFRPAVTYSDYETGSIAVRDVNADGKPDIVAVFCSGGLNCQVGIIGVLLGNGDGTFQPALLSASGGSRTGMAGVADMNRDGKPDVLLTNCDDGVCTSGGAIGILQGNGDGTFQPPLLYSFGNAFPPSAGLADVDADGRPDLLVWNVCSDGDCLGVMRNNAGPFHPTTTNLTSSLNPSVFGQSIAFTITVTSSSKTPAGTVFLLDGYATVGSATLTSGMATIALSSLPAGAHEITAWYPLSADFGGSTAVLSQAVKTASTSTLLTSSPNPLRPHQWVTYTAKITSQYGGNATGQVVFEDEGYVIITETVSGNQATYTTSYRNSQLGAHTIKASYLGDASNGPSTAPDLIEYVGSYPVASKTGLTTSGSPSLVGQPVTFTASVAALHPKFGVIPDGDVVQFYDGAVLLGAVPLAGGKAQYTTSLLAKGKHTIKAKYVGGILFRPSSAKLVQLVDAN